MARCAERACDHPQTCPIAPGIKAFDNVNRGGGAMPLDNALEIIANEGNFWNRA